MLLTEEAAKKKLETISGSDLKELAVELGIKTRGSVGEIRSALLVHSASVVDSFIRRKYLASVAQRQKGMADEDLKKEIANVAGVKWGVVQGKLDDKIQREYVRKFPRYADLEKGMEEQLYSDVSSYVKASWYNHWTTVLIEDHIAQHPNVVPTLKKIKGVDIFFRGQPFDVKITYVPKGQSVDEALEDPKKLAVWMYENQGEQRFGSENRFLIVLADRAHPEESWRLKQDFELVFKKIDTFLDTEDVTMDDVATFEFGGGTYSPLCKLLLIGK